MLEERIARLENKVKIQGETIQILHNLLKELRATIKEFYRLGLFNGKK